MNKGVSLICKLILITLTLSQCNKIKEYQEGVRAKRYGKQKGSTAKIPKWQQDVKEFEEKIDEKITAGSKAAKLYRKIGESFMIMESWKLCSKNIKKAIELGFNDSKVFYSLGLCQGNEARMYNWNYKKTKLAEETFLSLLKVDPTHSKAKFQLSLIYFYGFSRHNRYQILARTVTVKEKVFQEKAIKIMQEYQNEENLDFRSYFALAGMYQITNKKYKAQNQMQNLMRLIEKNQPKNFANNKKYIQARLNYKKLSSTKK